MSPEMILPYVTTGLTVLSLLVAVFQIRQVRLENYAKRKPYIVCKYRIERSNGKPDGVFLDLYNHGQTPAYNVRLDFNSETGWHWLQTPRFPFMESEEGITTIQPSERLSFYVGNLKSGSALVQLRSRSIKGIVTYGVNIGKKRLRAQTEAIRVTLQDHKYQTKA